MQLLHLSGVLLLVSFERFVDFFTLVDGVLLVVLDFLINVLELFLE